MCLGMVVFTWFSNIPLDTMLDTPLLSVPSAKDIFPVSLLTHLGFSSITTGHSFSSFYLCRRRYFAGGYVGMVDLGVVLVFVQEYHSNSICSRIVPVLSDHSICCLSSTM